MVVRYGLNLEFGPGLGLGLDSDSDSPMQPESYQRCSTAAIVEVRGMEGYRRPGTWNTGDEEWIMF
jgi:hypothetical protein